MFRSLRLQLTAWYLLVFAVVLVVMALVVFVAVRSRLTSDVDASIYPVVRAATLAVEGQTSTDAQQRLTGVLRQSSLNRGADVFVLLLDSNGNVVSNPRDVPTEALPVRDALAAARTHGSEWRDVELGGSTVRLRTVALRDGTGGISGFLQAGKSLEERDETLKTVLLVMSIAGGTGVILAGLGGAALSEYAIRPIRRSFARQQEFVLDASHELRTPVAVIRSSAESLAAGHYDAEAVDDIVSESQYISKLLDDLLTLAASDEGQLTLRKERVDLREVAQAAGRAAAAMAPERAIEVNVADAPLWVDVDPIRCRESMLILLDNALRYSPPGTPVRVRCTEKGRMGVVSISDRGPGIPAEEVGRVFERFYRADKARSRSGRSVGIGLSIAQAIMKAHGGSIELASKREEGTTVTLSFPLA
jgi:signal transduction histidine kinase